MPSPGTTQRMIDEAIALAHPGGEGGGAGGGDFNPSGDTTGDKFFVDSGKSGVTDGADKGTSASNPMATIDGAINRCAANNGDVIIVMPGHAETVTAAITMDVAGVTIIGLGHGLSRPYVSCATASIDVVTMTAADCTISNIGFNESTAAVDSTINVAAANCVVDHCWFDQGATDLEAITIATAGDDCLVEDNTFRVSADGPNAAVRIEGTSDNTIIRRNIFDGGSAANAYDAAAIHSTTACLAVTIENNEFRWVASGTESILLSAVAEPPRIRANTYYAGAALASRLDAPEFFYVNSGKGDDVTGKGLSRDTPAATIDFAVGLCSANAGDTIIVTKGHAENIAAGTDLVIDIAGVSIIGEGTGRNRPVLTYTNSAGTCEMDAANCLIENIVFFASVTGVTVCINVDAADCTIRNCEFDFDASADDFITGIDIDTVDRATVTGCRFIAENGTTGMSEAIRLDTANEATIRDNVFTGDFTDGVIVLEGAASNSVDISDNRMWNGHANARNIVNSIASQGLFDNNVMGFEDDQAHAQTLLASASGQTLQWQVAKHVSSVFVSGTNTHGDHDGTADAYVVFTVTGDILIQAIWGVCNTNLAGGSATLQLGCVGNTAEFIAIETGTNIDDGDIWCEAALGTSVVHVAVGPLYISGVTLWAINDGANIIETVATASLTGGQIDYYCIWAPVEDGAKLIAAEAVA